MNPLSPSQNTGRVRRPNFWVWGLIFGLPLYALSIGPVAWATNDAFHPRYLPEQVMLIYLPLAPLAQIDCISRLLHFYTAVLWGGFPAGYTTL